MAGRPANGEARATARALAASGTSTTEIARQLGTSTRQVRRWCEGLLPARPGPRPRDIGLQAVEAARAGGATWREVEEETGVPRSTAHRRATPETADES